jgi:hypothetical protein
VWQFWTISIMHMRERRAVHRLRARAEVQVFTESFGEPSALRNFDSDEEICFLPRRRRLAMSILSSSTKRASQHPKIYTLYDLNLSSRSTRRDNHSFRASLSLTPS